MLAEIFTFQIIMWYPMDKQRLALKLKISVAFCGRISRERKACRMEAVAREPGMRGDSLTGDLRGMFLGNG